MATVTATLDTLKASLARVDATDFQEFATDLLGDLGYKSDRTFELSGDVNEFVDEFDAENSGTQTETSFIENVTSVKIVFQVTDSEIEASVSSQGFRMDQGFEFEKGNTRSFVFVAVELNENEYPRGKYAEFTREINKRFNSPVVVLFKTPSNLVTLAFVHRREHKRDKNRDVLGSVSLIRQIDTANPHRAHLDILSELSLQNMLDWMSAHNKPINFDGLLAAWLAKLDTQELNKSFYRELFDWFERAKSVARFPTGETKTLPPEEHVIRLITRLLFIWFMKEKSLVAEELFTEEQIKPLLNNYDPIAGDSYYRAVLQNLFFATLNTEVTKRGFSKQSNSSHRDFSLFRHRKEMRDPDALVALFSKTPFINGGLFDCLDSEESTSEGGYRIDCFSDNPYHKSLLLIPNHLFFGQGNERGIIDIFNRYKFTIEENTPAEQEVALDPELLGTVFENLLAAINPETRESARKETGSYYTPRPVVEYMVDQALVASLVQKLNPADKDVVWWEDRLHYLLDYNDAGELFEDAEAERVVRAIAELRVLDPAAGSGAFPMGVLHKLTLALRRIDPNNQRWEDFQKELAGQRATVSFDTLNQQERDAELQEISDTFERYRESDFGRKLYLIQNSIFGVDVQSIACQIAKLRFFISLVIEQHPDFGVRNYGVKPLPNLETRFVAANTLLGLDKPVQIPFGGQNRVSELNELLKQNRERHFHATIRSRKLQIRKEDKRLREELYEELTKTSMDKSDAANISSWDPYNQNDSANWFDASYMFGVRMGFDIVIGNPPYKQVRKGIHSSAQFPYSEGRDKGKQNLYKLFVEQSYNLAKDRGLATLIVQSSLMCDLSSAATRRLLLERTRLQHVIEFPKSAPTPEAQLFQSVVQGTCIYQFSKNEPNDHPIMISKGNNAHSFENLNFATITPSAIKSLYPDLLCLPLIDKRSVDILERIARDPKIRLLRDFVSSIVQGDLNLSAHSDRYSHKPTPVRLLRGRNIGRFVVKYETSDEYCVNGFMTEKVERNRRIWFLISQQVSGTNDIRRLHFGLAAQACTDYLCGHSTNKTQLKNRALNKPILALLNSKFMDWWFRVTSTNNNVQGYELKQLPIPVLSSAERNRLEALVERIITTKAVDYDADTSSIEAEIDKLVYQLYDLTPEEIAAIAQQH